MPRSSRRVRVVGFGFLLATIFCCFFSRQTSALSSQVLTVSPTIVQTSLSPNSTANGSVEVINQGKASYSYTAYATPYRVSGEDYQPGFTYLPGAPKVADWFKLSINKGSLNPEQSETINYSISVPANTPAGGYYAVIFAQTIQPKVANSVTINERAGTIFYIEVSGPVVKQGKVISWKANWLQKTPLTANLRLNNTGSIHYFSNIQMSVSDIFGGTKFNLQTQKALLPQTVRLVPLTWPKGPSLGIFKVKGTASIYGKNYQLPTRYVLVMSPTIRIILVAIPVLVLLLFLAKRLGRRQVDRQSKDK